MTNHVTLRLFGLLLVLALASCGSDECTVASMSIDPQAGSADHNALPPNNAVQFFADANYVGKCVVPAPMNTPGRRGLQDVLWTVSDTVNVSISNVQDPTFGTATCLGPTSGAATVTANLPAGKNRGKQLVATGLITCN